MKVRFFIGLVSVFFCPGIFASGTSASPVLTQEVAMPAAEVLAERLNKQGFDHFVEQTNIHKIVGGKRMTPVKVVLALDCVLFQYTKCLLPQDAKSVGGGFNIGERIAYLREKALEALLQDIPGAADQNALEEKMRKAAEQDDDASCRSGGANDGAPSKALNGWCTIL